MKHFCGDRKAKKAMKKALKEKRILPWSAYRRAKRTYEAEYDALVAAQMSPEDAKERACFAWFSSYSSPVKGFIRRQADGRIGTWFMSSLP